MPRTGFEPVRGYPSQDFKSCASASSATPAKYGKSPTKGELTKRTTRFELATPTMARLCSTPELRSQRLKKDKLSQTLYLASLGPTVKGMPTTWFEHATLWLQIRCSTNWAKSAIKEMRMKGLEPPRPKALEPKSSVSANFTTSAWQVLLRFIPQPNVKVWPVLGSNQRPFD